MMWKERQRELLSDGEWDGLCFSTMIYNLVDVREQHKLSLECGPSELGLYDVCCAGGAFEERLKLQRNWVSNIHVLLAKVLRIIGG